MLQHEITYGVLSAFLSMFINYCLGLAGGNFSATEIFSGYTIWLAKRRIKASGQYEIYEQQFKGHSKKDRGFLLYNAAEELFTWEKAVGMCVICTGFWIALICGLFYTFNPVTLLEIILISHVTIRILAKLL